MSPYRVSEQKTRYNLIDPQLKKAHWNLFDHTQVGFEIPGIGCEASSAPTTETDISLVIRDSHVMIAQVSLHPFSSEERFINKTERCRLPFFGRKEVKSPARSIREVLSRKFPQNCRKDDICDHKGESGISGIENQLF